MPINQAKTLFYSPWTVISANIVDASAYSKRLEAKGDLPDPLIKYLKKNEDLFDHEFQKYCEKEGLSKPLINLYESLRAIYSKFISHEINVDQANSEILDATQILDSVFSKKSKIVKEYFDSRPLKGIAQDFYVSEDDRLSKGVRKKQSGMLGPGELANKNLACAMGDKSVVTVNRKRNRASEYALWGANGGLSHQDVVHRVLRELGYTNDNIDAAIEVLGEPAKPRSMIHGFGLLQEPNKDAQDLQVDFFGRH